jgi:hypothetical protein
MKIRKGRRKYAVLLNARTQVCYLTRAGSSFDATYGNHCFITSFECAFREAVHNLGVAKDNGYYITKRLR